MMKLGYAIPRDIVIKPSANMGFVIKIGCGVFVVEGAGSLMRQLATYLEDPEKWEKEYNELPGGATCEERIEPSRDAPDSPDAAPTT